MTRDERQRLIDTADDLYETGIKEERERWLAAIDEVRKSINTPAWSMTDKRAGKIALHMVLEKMETAKLT